MVQMSKGLKSVLAIVALCVVAIHPICYGQQKTHAVPFTELKLTNCEVLATAVGGVAGVLGGLVSTLTRSVFGIYNRAFASMILIVVPATVVGGSGLVGCNIDSIQKSVREFFANGQGVVSFSFYHPYTGEKMEQQCLAQVPVEFTDTQAPSPVVQILPETCVTT